MLNCVDCNVEVKMFSLETDSDEALDLDEGWFTSSVDNQVVCNGCFEEKWTWCEDCCSAIPYAEGQSALCDLCD